ncbi:nuclear transport factor 2 family protein [Paraburkholderia bengalensis]|uniref:Nuclear transport factor 2 family protein n=1 Tax=Paraburkholderia bengalensis TaxID=2747562 RepID=A0ABU8J770_9BURK
MKKLIIAATIVLACSGAFAKNSDEYALTDAMYHLTAAMIDGDAQRLRDLTTDTLTYGQPNDSLQNQSAFVAAIATGRVHYRRIDLTHTLASITGNTAVIRNHFSATTESNGKFTEVDLDELLVWQQSNGRWRLLARQGCRY